MQEKPTAKLQKTMLEQHVAAAHLPPPAAAAAAAAAAGGGLMVKAHTWAHSERQYWRLRYPSLKTTISRLRSSSGGTGTGEE